MGPEKGVEGTPGLEASCLELEVAPGACDQHLKCGESLACGAALTLDS